MNLHQIKYFLAIVDTGNFSRAAQRTHVTQSTLSTGIRRLEEELGRRLFERTTRGVQLNQEGKRFLDHARVIHAEMEKVKQELDLSDEPQVLRIGLLKTLPMDPIAKGIHTFRQLHPAVIVEFMDDDNERIRAKLEREQIELGITSLRFDDQDRNCIELFEEELMIAVNHSSALARMKAVELDILDGQPFIERINCDRWHDMHREFEQRGIHPRAVYWAETDQSVLSLIGAGVGLSIMPARANTNRVMFVPIKGINVKRKIGLIWKEARETFLIREFCAFAKTVSWT